jgi:hypothetical protein
LTPLANAGILRVGFERACPSLLAMKPETNKDDEMTRFFALAGILFCVQAVHATWYRVDAVPAYNKIRAVAVDGENNPVSIRIRNLEKIEYIQPDPEKVLLGGKEALQLSQKILKGQVVWIENLQAEGGEYAGDLYPSFESVMHAYRDHRLVGGDNITPSIRKKLLMVYRQMFADFSKEPLLQNPKDAENDANEAHQIIAEIYSDIIAKITSTAPKITSADKEGERRKVMPYEGEYQRAVFSAEAVAWFREKGQNLNPFSQKVFAKMLKDFQNEGEVEARYSYLKLQEFMKQEKFFRELFLETASYERGKFAYRCLEWFKNRGQFFPTEVQSVFVSWLYSYQQARGQSSQAFRDRLDWMMKNDKLYQDFLDVGGDSK